MHQEPGNTLAVNEPPAFPRSIDIGRKEKGELMRPKNFVVVAIVGVVLALMPSIARADSLNLVLNPF
jgi:hypothetical protein